MLVYIPYMDPMAMDLIDLMDLGWLAHKNHANSMGGCWIEVQRSFNVRSHVGVSENMENPLNPMVLLIITPIKWLFYWEYTLFSDKPMSVGLAWQLSKEFRNAKPGLFIDLRMSLRLWTLMEKMKTTSLEGSMSSVAQCFVKFFPPPGCGIYQWIGLRENLQETIDFPMKYGAFL